MSLIHPVISRYYSAWHQTEPTVSHLVFNKEIYDVNYIGQKESAVNTLSPYNFHSVYLGQISSLYSWGGLVHEVAVTLGERGAGNHLVKFSVFAVQSI